MGLYWFDFCIQESVKIVFALAPIEMSNQNLPSSRSVHSFQFRIAFKWSSFESPSFFVRLLGDFQLAVGPKDFRPPKDLLLAPSSFKRSTPTMPPPQRRWKLGNRCPRYPRTQGNFWHLLADFGWLQKKKKREASTKQSRHSESHTHTHKETYIFNKAQSARWK